MSQTNWNDVQRFSALLKQNKPTATPVPSATAAPPSGTPKALPTTTSQQGTVKK
jgi:hypothetical protein